MIGRRQFTNLMLAAPLAASVGRSTASKAQQMEIKSGGFGYLPGITTKKLLTVPQDRQIRVAFVINPGVQVIDLAGPWETFQDTYVSPDAAKPAFQLFTISDSLSAIRGSGGLSLVPDYTPEKAPVPDVIVVPHFDVPSPFTRELTAVHDWIRVHQGRVALTMSICTGAFQLAKTGLLDGVPMTTNRLASDSFARTFPKPDLRRGPRFVESGSIATAGGLSAGIDLALRVVARYFGEPVAQQTADRMEYIGTGWRV